jgi:hypothetical protein
MPHVNSLLYNVFVIPYWPMKVYWFTMKSLKIATLNDFPTPDENHPDKQLKRTYLW